MVPHREETSGEWCLPRSVDSTRPQKVRVQDRDRAFGRLLRRTNRAIRDGSAFTPSRKTPVMTIENATVTSTAPARSRVSRRTVVAGSCKDACSRRRRDGWARAYPETSYQGDEGDHQKA